MPNPVPQARVRVHLPPGHDRSYEVLIGSGLLTSIGVLARATLGDQARRIALVLDSGALACGHDPTAAIRTAGFEVSTHTTEPSEAGKSLDALTHQLRALAEAKLERTDAVIAVGGGVTGDLAGFAAAVYRRGIPVIQCPTTLLSMVDASVGGKTGVNLTIGPPGGETLLKNVIGAFHQPRLVVIDPGVLTSLPPRHLSAGLAECTKHAMIGATVGEAHAGLLEWSRRHLAACRGLHAEALTDLIARNVALKADVVSADELELADDAVGGRALLNLGHTFGHAIETLNGLSTPDGRPWSLLHGEAVALGLRAASAASLSMGDIPALYAASIDELLTLAGLPLRVRGLPSTDALLARMAHDKKARAGQLRVILPTGPGTARVVVNPSPTALAAGFDAIRG